MVRSRDVHRDEEVIGADECLAEHGHLWNLSCGVLNYSEGLLWVWGPGLDQEEEGLQSLPSLTNPRRR